MKTDTIKRDPPIAVMTMDIFQNILLRANNPGDLGKYLTEEIRNLTGARSVLLIRRSVTEKETGHKIIYVDPVNNPPWTVSPEIDHIYEEFLTSPLMSFFDAKKMHTGGELLLREGYEHTFVIPLVIGETHIGAIIALGIPSIDLQDTYIELFRSLSTLAALVLQNSFLNNMQEKNVEERTNDLLIVNNEMKPKPQKPCRAEEAEPEDEKKYRMFFEESFDGLFFTSPEGKILDMNRKGISMFGYDTKEEILRLDLERDIYAYPNDRRWVLSTVNTHGSAEYEMIVRKKNGEKMHTYCYLTAVRDEKGVITSYRGIIRDITERKKADKALQESEKMYRSVVNAMAEGFSLVDASGKIIAVNSAAEQITGRTAEELIGRTYEELELGEVHEDGSLFLKKDHPLMNAFYPGQTQSNMVMGIHRPDGTIRWISINSEYLIADGESKPYAVISTFHDFTDRKRAEEAVHVAIKLNHLIGTMTLDECMNFTIDEAEQLTDSTTGFFHLVNPDEQTIQLVTWSTKTRKNCNILTKPDKKYPVSKAGVWVDCLRQRRPVIHNDYAGLPDKKGLPEGHATVIRELVVPIFDENNIVAIIGVGNKATDYVEEDINVMTLLAKNAWVMIKRKQVEEEIRINKDKFRILADYTYDWEYWINPDRTVVYTTPSCARITGYTADEFLKEPTLLQKIIHPDDLSPLNMHFNQSDLTQGTCSIDFRIITRKGDTRWINHICEPIFGDTGRFLGRRVTNRDITKRKNAELALTESEEKYRTLVENIRVGVFQSMADETGSFIWVNPAMATLFGYNSSEELLLIHPSDLYFNPEERTKYLEKILKDGFVKNFEVMMKKKDGVQIWISNTSYIRYGPDGAVLWIDGFLEDISEHYQIEELKWKAFHQIQKNIEQFSILNDEIRNPLAIILALISDSNFPRKDIIEQEIKKIDGIVNKLDKGYVESEKVNNFLRKHQPWIYLERKNSGEE